MRRLKLDFRIALRIAKLLRKGYTISEACVKVGLSRQSFYNYYDKGKLDYESGKTTIFAKFYLMVERSLLSYQMSLMTRIEELGMKREDWRALLAILERRFPDKWRYRETVETMQNVNLNVVTGKDLLKLISNENENENRDQ